MTKYKINQIDLLDPLPFTPPKEVNANDLEVVDEQEISSSVGSEKDSLESNILKKEESQGPPKTLEDTDNDTSTDGQTSLF